MLVTSLFRAEKGACFPAKMADGQLRTKNAKFNIQQTRQQLLQQTLNSPKAVNKSPLLLTRGGSNPSLLQGEESFTSTGLASRYEQSLTDASPRGSPFSKYGLNPQDGALFSSKASQHPSYNQSFVQASQEPDQSTMMSSAAEMSNMSLLVEKDPEIFGSGVLFSYFRESLAAYPLAGQVFDLTAEYERICRGHIQKLLEFINQVDPTRQRFQRTTKMINFLYQECYTWRLIGSLIKDRLQTESEDADQMEHDDTLDQDEFTSHKKVIERLFAQEPSTRYCQLIVDWLEKNAEDQLNDLITNENLQFASDSVSWEHTLHGLKQSGNAKSQLRTVTEIDPDAPLRQRRPLADLDQMDETRLLRFAFTFLRAGKLEEAKKIFVKYGQSWRAATLDGWRLWHDPNFESLSEDEMVDVTEGNPFGHIWKACCWKMCEDNDISSFEKAIYAALSGNLKQLLPVCTSWEDCLWAYFKVLLDGRVEQELKVLHDDSDLPQEYFSATEDLTPSKIFSELDAHPDFAVRSVGKDVFHLFQRFMILDEPQQLMNEFNMHVSVGNSSNAHMLRFMTHALLFFQTVGVEVNDDLYTRTIQKYIDVLIAKNQWDQVAVYTAKLPLHLQVDTYAHFLEQMEMPDKREYYLQQAKEAHLDVQSITKRVVENIRESNPDEMKVDSNVTTGDKKKIAAIEWLILEPGQRIEAILQANAIIRGFLSSNKLESAKEVFKKLPKNSIDVIQQQWEAKAGSAPMPPEHDNAKKEYLCIKAYLDAHTAFDAWFHHYHNVAPQKPKQHQVKNFKDQVTLETTMQEYAGNVKIWKRTVDTHVENVSEKIYNVLLFPEGWMVDVHENSSENVGRTHQLKHIQQVSIPLLCFLLHSVLHSSGHYKECLQIADFIQDEQRKLYSVFRKEDLREFLGLLKDSSLCLLNESKDFMGYDVQESY